MEWLGHTPLCDKIVSRCCYKQVCNYLQMAAVQSRVAFWAATSYRTVLMDVLVRETKKVYETGDVSNRLAAKEGTRALTIHQWHERDQGKMDGQTTLPHRGMDEWWPWWGKLLLHMILYRARAFQCIPG